MTVETRFLTVADFTNYSKIEDSNHILQSGIDLYYTALMGNPYREDENSKGACVAILDGRIVGRFMLFQSKLKVGDEVIPIQTGGGILVSEYYRGEGIGSSMIRSVLKNSLYFGALYTRAAYDIIKKTETMLEIPQFVKYRYRGIKRLLDFPIFIRRTVLKRRFVVKQLSIVPEWAGTMVASEGHKYMEVHSSEWLQWALDNNATGDELDGQYFYAIYNKMDTPVGFFMTKVRRITRSGESFVKANLIEWASTDFNHLDEADINILSLETYKAEVSRFWTISESIVTAKKLKLFSYKRRGWFAMSITKNNRLIDAGDVHQWRVRYGCCNTALVE